MTTPSNASMGNHAPDSDGDETAIHDLGYRRYNGARIGASGAWRALYWQGFRAMFGFGRSAKAKILPAFVVLATLLPALGLLAAAQLLPPEPLGEGRWRLQLYSGAKALDVMPPHHWLRFGFRSGHVTEYFEAISEAEANRPSGTCSVIFAFRSSESTDVMSVSTGPGATTLTVMLRLPSSRASERARPTRPALDAA